MPAYITIEELGVLVPKRTMIELSNDDHGDTINTIVVQGIIDRATEFVNGYLRGRYTLPFDFVPTMIKQLTETVARYLLYSRRPEGELPDTVDTDYKNTKHTLELIRDGKVSIGYPETQESLPDDGDIAVSVRQSQSNTSGFSRAELDQY